MLHAVFCIGLNVLEQIFDGSRSLLISVGGDGMLSITTLLWSNLDSKRAFSLSCYARLHKLPGQVTLSP